MLPQTNRLKKNKDIDRVFKFGKGYKEDALFLKILYHNSGHSRFVFTIAQKAVKKATDRNRIKRILSETVRLRLPKFEKGIDGVFVILPGFQARDFFSAEKLIDKLFKKARLQYSK